MAYFDKYGVEFSDDRKTLVRCPKDMQGEYVIPNGVTSIGDSAFAHCYGMTSIMIPNSVFTIGSWAFRGCSGLTSVEIPFSIRRIKEFCFYLCKNLKHITIYSKEEFCIEEIGDGIFRGCQNLESIVVIGGNPKPSPQSYSRGCGEYELYSMDGVLYAYEVCKRYNSRNCFTIARCLVAFPGGKKISTFKIRSEMREMKIFKYAFSTSTYLKRIEIINHSPVVFWHSGQEELVLSKNIEEVIVPCRADSYKRYFGDKVKESDYLIDDQSFYHLRQSMDGDFAIPNGVRRICDRAFYKCSVSRLFIPDTVTEISEKEPFDQCENLIGIHVSADNPNYSSIDGVLYNKEKTILIKCPNSKILSTLPNNVIQIMSDAFERGN